MPREPVASDVLVADITDESATLGIARAIGPDAAADEPEYPESFEEGTAEYQQLALLDSGDEFADLSAAEQTVEHADDLVEGSLRRVYSNSYERNPVAREKCIAYYGVTCCVCGFDFAATYGAIGKGYIEVHHLVPLSDIGGVYCVDPVRDLRPVCPNCHAMIHRRDPPYAIEELKARLR